MPNVRVKGLDAPLEVEEGTDLRAACRTNRVNLFWGPWAQAFNCRGLAFCNLCRVQVLDGAENLSPKTSREAKRLRNAPPDWRLACHAKVRGDVTIEPYPMVHAQERVSSEALRLALLSPEERAAEREKAIEAELDRHAGDVEARKKARAEARKGLFAKFRRKGADDEGEEKTDAPEGSTPAQEEEAAGGDEAEDAAQPKKKRFGKLLARTRGKGTAAEKEAALAGDDADDAPEGGPGVDTTASEEAPATPEAAGKKKRFALGRKKG